MSLFARLFPLRAALGKLYFSPLAALPGAVFAVWHDISGSLPAGIRARRQPAKPADGSPAVADAGRR